MPKSYQLKLLNMHCASCITTIEEILKSPDIIKLEVNYATRTVAITGEMPLKLAVAKLQHAGYKAIPFDENSVVDIDKLEQIHCKSLLKKAILAGVTGLALMTAMNVQLNFWVALTLSLVTLWIMWYTGSHIFRNAWSAFWQHLATMDTLITLGTGTAWIYSMGVVLWPEWFPTQSRHLYFEAALIIIAFVNLGAALEVRARGKTSQALGRLLNLQPKTAKRVNSEGNEQEVKIEALAINDKVKVRPGESIAVDGIIIDGQAVVDESMVTGESEPVFKQQGDNVIGGTIVKSGSVLFTVTQISGTTLLDQIIKLVKQAQMTKPAIAKLADQVSAFFVPSVLLFAIATGLLWINLGYPIGFILVMVMAVLVIACPCALGLATPISVMIGMGKAAEYGILIRNGDALQRASKLTTIVLDKTGTITKGQPEVTDIYPLAGYSAQQVLQYAASLEHNSEHHLAEAILAKAKQCQLPLIPLSNFMNQAGTGVTAELAAQKLLLGNEKLMQQHGISTEGLTEKLTELSKAGKSTVLLAVDQKIVGILAAIDPIKIDSLKAVAILKQLGFAVFMLTGDSQHVAEVIAKQVGIDKAVGRQLPSEKAEFISTLQAQGEIVGMVGDGVNDAPALAKADVGFAIGAGTDVAIASADITLISNSLLGIAHAIVISKATITNIKQNLWGAFIYNILGIPVAAGLLYPILGLTLNPMFAGLAMMASSLTVISNANRLRWFNAEANYG